MGTVNLCTGPVAEEGIAELITQGLVIDVESTSNLIHCNPRLFSFYKDRDELAPT
jgi:hypothetical protein